MSMVPFKCSTGKFNIKLSDDVADMVYSGVGFDDGDRWTRSFFHFGRLLSAKARCTIVLQIVSTNITDN